MLSIGFDGFSHGHIRLEPFSWRLINEHPAVAEGRILMMGLGRWGSSNIDLGNFPLDNRTIVILGYISSAKKYL